VTHANSAEARAITLAFGTCASCALGTGQSPGVHGATEGVVRLLEVVPCKQPQHAINIGSASHIHRIFGQCIHGGEITCEPVSVGEVETIAPNLKKGLTRC
jgi:hypothetical protein